MSEEIKPKVSVTARGTCIMRATSYYEENPYYKSEDFIAPKIIPALFHKMAKYNISRNILKNAVYKAPGMYEYVISRTKFIDQIYNSLPSTIEQVLIFGAGFDSRAIRFSKELKNAKVFELDAPVTQQAKLHRFAERNINFPPNVKFIAIDFNKESLVEKLAEAGFQKNRKCLFLLEGLTYYLDEEAIESTLHLISDYSEKDSLLVFDYAATSAAIREKMMDDASMRRLYQNLVKVGEKPGFMLEGQIEDFLLKYNFELGEELDSTQLAERYFNQDHLGVTAQQFRIVKAIKKSDCPI
jgi:methyltransferase (TIGR00027 family)